jgi:hypothetical protein
MAEKKRSIGIRLRNALVAGLISTVASTWFLCWWRPLSLLNEDPSDQLAAHAEAVIEDREWFMGDDPAVHFSRSGMGTNVSVVVGSLASDSLEHLGVTLHPIHEFGMLEAGVPFTCLEGTIHKRNNRISQAGWAFPVPEAIANRAITILPLKPRLLGFVLNVLIHAAAIVAAVGGGRWVWGWVKASPAAAP